LPKKVEYPFDPHDTNDQYARLYADSVVELINHLQLARYGLRNYLLEKAPLKPTSPEAVIIANLSRAGKRLMGFCRTNLFKRLESSGYSFLLSLSRHVLRNFIFIHAIQNRLPLPIGKNISENLDDWLEDEDLDGDGDDNTLSLILDEDLYLRRGGEVYDLFVQKYQNRFEWIRSEWFDSTLLEALTQDSRDIITILKLGQDWNAANDRQLNALDELLNRTHAKDKVLVFTQYADTAYYLTGQLQKRGMNDFACVTGDSENPTDLAWRFSPRSNLKPDIIASGTEVRVLITTDVLSEGQNLQDGHIVVNYDLPWAIIRLIQRSGRVDRIGQKSDKIICYSFLPEDGLERIIRLRNRLTNRIRQNAEVVGSDETFFEGDPVNIADLYNEKAGILDEEEDAEVDLASYAYQIWKNATDADPTLLKIIPDLPNVLYATKKNEEELEKQGVAVYARTAEENDMLACRWSG